MVGRLERVDLRKVWIKEAKDFSTWLENNLDILSEHTDLWDKIQKDLIDRMIRLEKALKPVLATIK